MTFNLEFETGWMLVGAGFLGGLCNAIAGGATLITFPALFSAGLSAIQANASSALAVSPGHFLAAVADRDRLPYATRRWLMLLASAFLGGGFGGLLLLWTSERIFQVLVPALIGLATMLFVFGPRIQSFFKKKHIHIPLLVQCVIMLIVTIYGGYFGAGLGIMLMAILSVMGESDVRAANVQKNVIATLVSVTAVGIFIAKDLIHWPFALTVLAGAAVGGYIGGKLISKFTPWMVRLLVTSVGLVMTLSYAWLYWLK